MRKTTTKLLSLLLAFIMLIGIITEMLMTASAANYIFPVLGNYSVSSPYGNRSNGYHYGIDIATSGNANAVVAAASGTVVSVSNNCPHVSCGYQCEHYSTYGNMVAIRHSDGKCSYYGHLKKDSIKVSVGDTVVAGQQVASVGSSGYSTGYHLHFEIRTSYGATRSTTTCLNVNPSSLGYSYIDSPVPVNNTSTYVNIIDNYANISWYDYPGATMYNVRIKKIVNGVEISDDYSIWNVTTPYAGKELENGYYKVYVDAIYSGGNVIKYSDTYFTINSSNSINPTKVSVMNSTAKFSWAAYRGASVYNVRIKSIVNGIETSEDYSVWNVKSTSTSIDLPDGTYRAYVDAVCGNSWYKYKNAEFTIKSSNRETNYTKSGNSITFSWSVYPTATAYNVRIIRILNGEETSKDYSIWNESTTTATKTFEEGDYKAYVDAIYQGGIYKYEETYFSIEKCSHTYNSVTTIKATCIMTGLKTFSCSKCGDTYTETIPKQPHSTVKDSAISATCTKNGKTEGSHCSTCGEVIVEQKEVPALGHTPGKWIVTVEPTKETEGIRIMNCSVCGEFIQSSVIPKIILPKVKSVTVSDASLDYLGTTVIKPTIIADDGASYTVTYSSSNPSVATVDNNGKVTSVKQSGLNRGSATITVKVTDSNGNTVTDTCKVTVNFVWWQWIVKIVLFGWIWY